MAKSKSDSKSKGSDKGYPKPKGKGRRGLAVTIRGFEPADVEPLALVWREPSTVAGTLQLPFQSVDELRKRWTGQNENRRVVVAEVASQPVGMGSVHISPRPRARHSAGIGMAVSEKVRGRGVGGAILDALIDIAEGWFGVLRLELTVWVDNDPAIRLYRSRGFEIEGVLRANALRDGVLVDAFQMARVSDRLPFDRVTAEDVKNRKPPQLTAGPNPKKNGDSGKKKDWDYS